MVVLGESVKGIRTGGVLLVLLNGIEAPDLNWLTAMFRKRRTENGEQATEAGRDCLGVTAS